MEQVSAFAAYQSLNSIAKKSAKNKSPKAKKLKKGNVQSTLPTEKTQKKRKATDKSESEATPSKASKTAKVANRATAAPISILKKATPSKPQSQPKMNGTTVQFNGSIRVAQSNNDIDSSIENGKEAFSHILSGYNSTKFMKENWEKLPLYIKRENEAHYNFLKVSTESIDEMLRTNMIEFTKNLDVTSYENGIRETHNCDGRALPGTVWDFYRNGCSVRLINPQTFIPALHKFNATVQEYFHCLVGANVYLTPPNSQGFAPHYDDIEAFVLQVEGKKEWMLYPPRSENEQMPRESSGNFQQDEIGEPCFTIVLEPGDMLYFPRGWIHQAKTIPNCHSLHITLSVYQKTSYADLFEELMKDTLKKAIESEISLRQGVPLDIWTHFGETYSNCTASARRSAMKDVLTNMFYKLKDHLDFDAAVDKLAIKYQHDALPPVLSSSEKNRTALGTAPVLRDNGEIDMPEMRENTDVRLLRAHIVRLACIDGVHHLYYYADNSKEYHGSDLNYIEVEDAGIDVIKLLIHNYPNYTKIRNLSRNVEEAMAVVYSLWDRGLIMTRKPLQ